jgi:SAM-dependent methyltransferase
MLIEAIDNLDAHVQMANWLANAREEQLQHFFEDFYPIPAQRKMQPLLARLIIHPTRPETGVWLRSFCEGTIHNDGRFMRPWRLLSAAWYASAFDPQQGSYYLKAVTGSLGPLPPSDNQLLMNTVDGINGTAVLIQLIADCPDPTIKKILQNFGHLDLEAVSRSSLDSQPDYSRLVGRASQAATDVALFQAIQQILEQFQFTPEKSLVLNLVCGELAEQALLLASAGYNVVAAGLDVPPQYLPVSGIKQWFSRRKHKQAWKEATTPYYQTLSRIAGMKLQWNSVKIILADPTRLDELEDRFDVVVCANHLHHAPDVRGLLGEACRILKPNGLFVANIRPFAGLTGAFQSTPPAPWAHLRPATRFVLSPGLPVNRWREQQYRTSLKEFFTLEWWQPEDDPQAARLLTPSVRAELGDYSEAELSRKQIFVVGKKTS